MDIVERVTKSYGVEFRVGNGPIMYDVATKHPLIKQLISETESLRARVQELEAGMGEPVAWLEFAPGSDYCFIAYSHNPKADSYPLFRTPPTVAAAIRKAAEVCHERANPEKNGIVDALYHEAEKCRDAILAIPHDDSALREICMRVAESTCDYLDNRNNDSYDYRGLDWRDRAQVVDRVLGEKK